MKDESYLCNEDGRLSSANGEEFAEDSKIAH